MGEFDDYSNILFRTNALSNESGWDSFSLRMNGNQCILYFLTKSKSIGTRDLCAAYLSTKAYICRATYIRRKEIHINNEIEERRSMYYDYEDGWDDLIKTEMEDMITNGADFSFYD